MYSEQTGKSVRIEEDGADFYIKSYLNEHQADAAKVAQAFREAIAQAFSGPDYKIISGLDPKDWEDKIKDDSTTMIKR